MINVEESYPQIVRCLQSLGVNRELIEDYSQDIAIKLLNYNAKTSKLPKLPKLKGWLWKIVRNYVIDEYRRTKRRTVDYTNTPCYEEDDDEVKLNRIYALHEALFDGRMKVVGQYYIDGKSLMETVVETGMRYNVVRTYRMRWRKRIRKAFKEYDF